MTEHPSDRAQFKAMAQGTQDDWMKIAAASVAFNRDLPNRVLAHLKMLKGDCGGFAVDRLEHSLQAATLAHRDGMDEEYVVCALMHDIGDILASTSHAELGATIMKPYVSEQNYWMMAHHGIFQGYYFFHYLGLDRDMREQFRGHPSFEYTARFCARHDQNAFDASYDTMPLEAFEPMVQRVMARPKNTIYMRPEQKQAAE
ncbi:MAG TPA: HD domain-containing protein [Rhizomicrobium sp.]|jgi:predicted HD phosphohydrolase|nr:HD domain-containing protein [Rhizomicrobium sp.]